VDVHGHVFVPEAEAVAKQATAAAALANDVSPATREVNRLQRERIQGKLTSVPARLADLDAMGIDVQVLSPAPPQFHYGIPPALGHEVARLINDRIAAMVAERPDRLVGLGTVPLQAPELAIAELERVVRRLGFRGVEIGTNVAGQELSAPAFRPFFAAAERLGALIFLHPVGIPDPRRLGSHYFTNVIGNPLDTTIAVSHLIFDGVLEAHPRLRILVAHGGGFLAAYPGRMDHAHRVRPDCRERIRRRPSRYLARLYFDTVVHGTDQLEYLARRYGSTRLLLGTDYPFDMGMPDPVGFVARARLTAGEKAAVLGGNALRLLGLPRARRAGRHSAPKRTSSRGAKAGAP
jgi:aminocarboxymuconate-semialdehyde decarboxylase